MTNNQATYISLLCTAIWSTKPQILSDVNIDAIIEIAKRHSTGPLIYDVLLREIPDRLTAQQKATMIQISMQQMQSQLNLLSVMKVAVEALNEDGFLPVVIKGFGLAALYPNPHLRPSGDIDLYVGTEHFPEACASILRCFPDAVRPDKMIYAGKHYNIEVGENVIETHRVSYTFHDLYRNRIYRQIEKEGMTGSLPKASYDEYEFSIPKPTFNALFVFLHAWHHFEHGQMNLRQLVDWTMVLHHNAAAIDHEQLRLWLKQLHMTEAWCAFGWVAVHYLSLPSDEMPLYDPSLEKRGKIVFNTIWSDLLYGRVYKVHKNKSGGRVARSWNTFRLILQNARWMWPILPLTAFREARIHFLAAIDHVLFNKKYE